MSDDADLAYLERKRLEDEFRKLKELKVKAEKYTVEAKQTALRLSAENSKLKEDLNKEKHHNDLTRSNILRELEEEEEGVVVKAEGGRAMADRTPVHNEDEKRIAHGVVERPSSQLLRAGECCELDNIIIVNDYGISYI